MTFWGTHAIAVTRSDKKLQQSCIGKIGQMRNVCQIYLGKQRQFIAFLVRGIRFDRIPIRHASELARPKREVFRTFCVDFHRMNRSPSFQFLNQKSGLFRSEIVSSVPPEQPTEQSPEPRRMRVFCIRHIPPNQERQKKFTARTAAAGRGAAIRPPQDRRRPRPFRWPAGPARPGPRCSPD